MDKYNVVTKKHRKGATINLFVTPNAKKSVFPTGLNKWRKSIEIKVCANAKENQANLQTIKIVADFFKTPINNVYIISGKKNRQKTILIKGLSVNNVIKMLKESLNGL
jgi:uncharacterized protein (TIGR00251 family)